MPWSLRALAWCVAKLPWRLLPILGGLLGFIAGTVLRIRRRHVDEAMRRGAVDPAAAPRMYRSLGTAIFELLWLTGRGPPALGEIASIDEASKRALDEARAGGKGVVLAASHTGNWDLAACRVAREAPLTVVTKQLSVRGLDAFWQRARARFGIELVPAEHALARGRSRLAQRGAVAMMIDQVPERQRHAVEGTFMNARAFLDKAPATLAARAGAPLVVAAARRDRDGRHVLHALLVRVPPDRAGTEWIEATTREASAALEEFVRAHPESWLWMHRRWKTPG